MKNSTSIESKEDLKRILTTEKYKGNLILEDNIDLGHESIPQLINFNGVFEGKGHSIRNISVNINKDIKYTHGLLINGNQGIVRNLRLENVDINNNWKIGGIVGTNHGEVKNCSVTGKINGEKNVGGIVCKNKTRGIVSECEFSGEITSQQYSGGIVGENKGKIENSHSNFKLGRKKDKWLKGGGIASVNNGSIENSYCKVITVGELKPGEIGMVVGDNSGGKIINCYWVDSKEDDSKAVLINKGLQEDVGAADTLQEIEKKIVARKI